MAALSTTKTVAVIGAGAMGAGIAQVAATAGHPVLLFDIVEGAAASGLAGVRKGLSKLVGRGKMTQERADEICGRIQPISELERVKDSSLVIEAIIEDLEIKKRLLADLEALCSEETILASNTSSLSISALAAEMQHPGRLAGMHFFNPAPILKLVEIISGLRTDPAVAECLYETASAWSKLPVYAKSTPGFIVNRVARPFYAEALRSKHEGMASAATIDAIMRECGGFKMGPFELTDLIGQDVNYAVTQSVFAAYYGDQRFQPSIVQRELVDAGLLGRKTGHGFYNHSGEQSDEPALAKPGTPPSSIRLFGDQDSTRVLSELAAQAGLPVAHQASQEAYIEVDGVIIALTDGRTATQRAHDFGAKNLTLFDFTNNYEKTSVISISIALQADVKTASIAAGFFQAIGKQVFIVKDVPGLQVMRTVCMLINEGADAVNQSVCDAASVDLAMKAGVAYPAGPMEWSDQIGLNHVATVLANLQQTYGEDRYRTSPLIQQARYAGKSLLEF